ncbi:cytochrome P450 4C1 [Caerostris extrusa]|uniref:Cytochrome P450 4C1 n=1 Tax=Caerostris extrusa TaxID=172846 RepID=A0AAV4R406_CAEEX|nr:cytochrome P450 4C1 [Caerostris extrusa]
MLLEIVACVSIVVIVLLVKLSWWRQRCNRLIPNNQPSFFNPLGEVFDYDAFEFSGQKHAVHLGIMKAFAKWSNKFKKYPLCCTWIAYTPYTLIHKSEAVRDLLQVKKNIEKSWLYYFFQTIGGKGLFTCDSTQWKDRRKLFAPCFQSNMLKGYLTVFNEHSQKFVNLLHKETEEGIHNCGRTDISVCPGYCMRMHYGSEYRALENESKQYVESLFTGQWIFMMAKSSQILAVAQSPLLEFENWKRSSLSQRKVVNDLSRTGHDTVATTIKWALYLIGLHPEVQEKIHQEVDSVFEGDAERPLSVDDLSDLKFNSWDKPSDFFGMKLVFLQTVKTQNKECNRLYPSVPQFGRHISEDTKICGYTAPKGASAIVMTYFLHRDEDVFPDPEKFDPERFLPERTKIRFLNLLMFLLELGLDIA